VGEHVGEHLDTDTECINIDSRTQYREEVAHTVTGEERQNATDLEARGKGKAALQNAELATTGPT